MEQPHIPLLRAFDELPFSLGKKTLAAFVKGDPHPTLSKKNLEDLNAFGCLFMIDHDRILNLLNQLEKHGYVVTKTVSRGLQVLERTPDGTKEIYEKQFYPDLEAPKTKAISQKYQLKGSPPDATEEKLMEQFHFFLGSYNRDQQHAIVSPANHLLCIAGAGSGKTTVLTKRIEFLNRFRGIPQEEILAITFTRKAKEEMESRLAKSGITRVTVATFNSFCEQFLRENPQATKKQRVITFRDKIGIARQVAKEQDLRFEEIANEYFTNKQRREKTADELFLSFVNDLFAIRDHYLNQNAAIEAFYEDENNPTKRRLAEQVHKLLIGIDAAVHKAGLRDFTEQITETLNYLKHNPDSIPSYSHILIDEFQDINSLQWEMIQTLNWEHLFVVGDPRQAIYGWRGSDVQFILDFPKTYPKAKVISLKTNYRSIPEVVTVMNGVIATQGLEDLSSKRESPAKPSLFLMEHQKENLERMFIAEAIKESENPRDEIFILARTNKILESMAEVLNQYGIPYAIKQEEHYQKELKENQVVLATVHAIKGMEAEEVYVMSANSLSFPNKVQDNFIMNLIKDTTPERKEQEELRLFYVALSRAKSKLIVSYTGTASKFLSPELQEHFTQNKPQAFKEREVTSKPSKFAVTNSTVLKNRLKDWRAQKARQLGKPTYLILSNEAIEELMRKSPKGPEELMNIRGINDIIKNESPEELLAILAGK